MSASVLVCGTNKLRQDFPDESARRVAQEKGLEDTEIEVFFCRGTQDLNSFYRHLQTRGDFKMIIDLGEMRQEDQLFDMTVPTEDHLLQDAARLGVLYQKVS